MVINVSSSTFDSSPNPRCTPQVKLWVSPFCGGLSSCIPYFPHPGKGGADQGIKCEISHPPGKSFIANPPQVVSEDCIVCMQNDHCHCLHIQCRPKSFSHKELNTMRVISNSSIESGRWQTPHHRGHRTKKISPHSPPLPRRGEVGHTIDR